MEGQELPDEPRRLGILLTGKRTVSGWMGANGSDNIDFFDLKGVVEGLLHGLHIDGATDFSPALSTCAAQQFSIRDVSALLSVKDTEIGVFGELHPLVAQAFDLTEAPVLAAEFDLDALLQYVDPLYSVKPMPVTPPVLQDIALVVKEETPAAEVERVIVKAGGDLLKGVRLFDVYHGDPIPVGHKSLAYSLTYQTDERTLTDKEVARVSRENRQDSGARIRRKAAGIEP